jgi:hypothetical protein
MKIQGISQSRSRQKLRNPQKSQKSWQVSILVEKYWICIWPTRLNWDISISTEISWSSRLRFWKCRDFLDRDRLSASVENESLDRHKSRPPGLHLWNGYLAESDTSRLKQLRTSEVALSFRGNRQKEGKKKRQKERQTEISGTVTWSPSAESNTSRLKQLRTYVVVLYSREDRQTKWKTERKKEIQKEC